MDTRDGNLLYYLYVRTQKIAPSRSRVGGALFFLAKCPSPVWEVGRAPCDIVARRIPGRMGTVRVRDSDHRPAFWPPQEVSVSNRYIIVTLSLTYPPGPISYTGNTM